LHLNTGDLNKRHGELASVVTAHREIGRLVLFASWNGSLEWAARREGLEVIAH
jgi:hypothetical protein